jgi:cytochrome c biogenesis protein CcmG/thiol:disulfide interchange protein DsbE
MGVSNLSKGSLFFLACCVLAVGCESDLHVLRPGDTPPPFTLADLDGNHVSLADFHGKTVMLRFWADWCKSCKTEMPLIEEKYRQFTGAGFRVLALNVRQDRERAAKFAKEVGISYPVLLDADGQTAHAYGVIGLPTTFVIDGGGRVREEIIGDMNRKSLSELLDPLFEKKSAGGNP